MKSRKPTAILAVVMAWLLFASTALAVVTIEADAVYANGHAITVIQDEQGRTRVTSDEPDAGLADDTTDIRGRDIYGGSKNKDYTGDTNVTIEGGTVGNVYGGGLNGDVKGSTNVTVNGGTTGDVYGGGNAIGGDSTGLNDGADQTANVSNGTNVTINGGSTGNVYGGGHADGGDWHGLADGGDATANVSGGTNVTINGGEVRGDVHGGGRAEAGYDGVFLNDGQSNANVTGGTNVTINGGTVRDYVSTGGDDRGSRASATVSGQKNIYINGGMIEDRDVVATGDKTKIYVNNLIGLYYRYYTDNKANVVVSSTLKDATGKTWKQSDLKWSLFGGYYYFDVPGIPQKVTVVFKYYDKSGSGAKVVKTESSQVWMTPLTPSQTISSTHTKIGENRYAIKSVKVSYEPPDCWGGGDRTITENIYPTAAKQVKVTTRYEIPDVTLAPDVKTHDFYPDDPAKEVGPVMPTFAGSEHYTFSVSPKSATISYTSGDVEFIVTGEKVSKQVKVTTIYNIPGKTLDPDVKTYTVYAGEPAQEVEPVMPTFAGSENYKFTSSPESASISFTSGDVVFNVTGEKVSKQVKVTTNYHISGMSLASDVKTFTVYAGDAAQEVNPTMPTFEGSEHYSFTADADSASISFTSGDVVFNVTGEPNSYTLVIRFNYLYSGTVIVSDDQFVTLTYGDANKTVTSSVAIPSGYYLLAPVPSVTVSYSMAMELAEQEVFEVEVPLGIVEVSDEGTPSIPLGPGATQTAIPLGLGVPSTGDSTGISILLMAMGVAVVAIVANKAKRSSAK